MAKLEEIANYAANIIAKSQLSGFGGGNLKNIRISVPLVSSFHQVNLTHEGLTLQADDWIGKGPSSYLQKDLSLYGSVTTSITTLASSGVWHAHIPCEEKEDEFPYNEYLRQQIGTYTVKSTLLPTPLKVEFELFHEGFSVKLNEASGTITIPNVHTSYATPIPGGADFYQPVHISYSISDNVVQLSNVPSGATIQYIFGRMY
jgi:hypothetical protein